MLKVNNICISVSNKELFKIEEFKAYKNTITVIYGESGCGKTTFLEALNNASIPYMVSDITVDNDNIRKLVTLSKQEPLLVESLTIKDNLKLHLNMNGVSLDKELYDHLVNLLELDSLLQQYPLSLSIGELKRASLFIHCMINKPILLLDEPTASLNDEFVHIVMEVIHIMKSKNKMIIISTHDDRIKNIADRIYEIKNQRLILIKNSMIEDDNEIQAISNKINPLSIHKILRNRKKYKRFLNMFLTCISLFIVSSLSFSFIYGQASINVLKDKLNKNVSNTMIVYKQIAPGVEQTFAFDNFPMLDETEKNYLKNHQFIKDIKNYYLISLEYIDDPSDKRHVITVYDDHKEKQNYNVFEEGITLNYSTYYEDFENSNGIIKRFNDEGVYISEYLAEFLNIDTNHSTIGIHLPILSKINDPGAYLRFYEGNDEYHYTTFHISDEISEYIEIKVAGVYDYNSIVYASDNFGLVLIPNDLYESYIAKYKFDEPYVIENEANKIFPRYTSYPYEACAFIVTYEPENVEDLMNDLYNNGFRYLSQYYDIESLLQAQKTNSSIFIFIGIIIFAVGCIISFVLNYIQRKENISMNRIFKLYHLSNKTYYQIMFIQWIEDTLFISIISIFFIYMIIKFQSYFNFAYTELNIFSILLIFFISSVMCCVLPFVSNLIAIKKDD